MQHVEVDGLATEARERSFQTFGDVPGLEIAGSGQHVVAAFAEYQDPGTIRALLEELPDQTLAAAFAVRVRGIDEVHARVDGSVQRPQTFRVVYRAESPADGHSAEADDADLEPGVAKWSRIHFRLLFRLTTVVRDPGARNFIAKIGVRDPFLYNEPAFC
ncbi:MAG: hypothetical protein E4H01_00465 [Lysobacterales bacterium]|nr:MAG: hypothetical protein E4H01_00465 [Xanthomonadales bacterium]